MGQKESWSAVGWIQNVKVDISVAQLMQIASKARVFVVEAICLELDLKRKAASKKKQSVRIDEGSQAEKMITHKAHRVQVFDADQSELKMSKGIPN